MGDIFQIFLHPALLPAASNVILQYNAPSCIWGSLERSWTVTTKCCSQAPQQQQQQPAGQLQINADLTPPSPPLHKQPASVPVSVSGTRAAGQQNFPSLI